MENQTKNTPISEFLGIMTGSKEVGLAIAKNQTELADFTKMSEETGFKRLDSILEYENQMYGQYLVVENADAFKSVYDFVCQYPLTVISLFDTHNSKIIAIKPDYKSSVVIILTKDTLKGIQQTGFDILGRTGLTYQS